MINLIRSEWIKFRSVRSTIVILLLAGGLVVLVAVLAARDAQDRTTTACRGAGGTITEIDGDASQTVDGVTTFPEASCPPGEERIQITAPTNLSSLTGGVSARALLFGMLGVQVIGQEYRFNTIRPTFTAAPHRLRVLAAKLVVVCGACAVVAALMVAFCWAVGSAMIDGFEMDGTDQRIAYGIVLFTAIWTALGLGLGAIVRQPVAGILILLGEAFVAENILFNLFPRQQQWLPFLNGFQMTLRVGEDPDQLRSVLSGGIYLAVVTAVVVAIGMTLADRRDA